MGAAIRCKFKSASFIGLIILITLIVSSCAPNTQVQEGSVECPIRLGSVRPETGSGAVFGNSLADGLNFGVDVVNEQGGILGCQVEIIAYDSQSTPANAATLTQRLITQDNVQLVIGSSISTETLAMMEITENAQVPIYVPS